jgi:hypothetical protein
MLQKGSEQSFSPKQSLIHIIRGMKQGILTDHLHNLKFVCYCILKVFLKKIISFLF